MVFSSAIHMEQTNYTLLPKKKLILISNDTRGWRSVLFNMSSNNYSIVIKLSHYNNVEGHSCPSKVFHIQRNKRQRPGRLGKERFSRGRIHPYIESRRFSAHSPSWTCWTSAVRIPINYSFSPAEAHRTSRRCRAFAQHTITVDPSSAKRASLLNASH